MKTFRVALFRENGRFVKYVGSSRRSRYAAKKILQKYEAKYDETYYLEIEEEL